MHMPVSQMFSNRQKGVADQSPPLTDRVTVSGGHWAVHEVQVQQDQQEGSTHD